MDEADMVEIGEGEARDEVVPSSEAEVDGSRSELVVSEVLSSSKDEVEGLRQQLRDKARLVVALEEEVERQEAESRRLREERDQLGGKLAGAQAQAQEALARYREKLLTSAPEVPPELIKGETVSEVEASLAAAQDLVERVRRQLLTQTAAERVPSGAPTRRGLDLSTLSPAEKIALGLQGR